MKHLDIGVCQNGKTFSLPLELVTTSLAILAKKRVGKSYLAAVFAEELMTAGQPVVMIDITGAHWGLKASADGKSARFPVVIFGGRHADVPLEDKSGMVVASAIATMRFSAILDFSIMSKSAMKRFLKDFLEEFYRINQEPIHLICDEADRYCPQQPQGDEAQLVSAMDDIVSRGGIKGIGVSIISQRSAKVNKNIVTQCELLVALRIVHPLDAKTIMEWVQMHATAAEAAEMLKSLPSLPIGTGWFWWPGAASGDIFERVKIRARTTYDSGATPKAGEIRDQPKTLAKVDVAKLGQDILATVQRAKDNDPVQLREKIMMLERRVRLAEESAAETRLAHMDMAKVAPAPIRVDVPVLTPSDHQRLDAIRQSVDSVKEVLAQADRSLSGLGEYLVRKLGELAPKAEAQIACLPTVAALERETEIKRRANESAARSSLSAGERRILTVLAQYPDGKVTVALAHLAGYTVNGHFTNMLGGLRSRGLVEPGQPVQITARGKQELGTFEPLPTGRALREQWLRKVSTGEAKILAVLLNEYPGGVSTEELAIRAGYTVNGHFTNMLGHLRTIELVQRGQPIKASDTLFE
jgi:hypothetical protein